MPLVLSNILFCNVLVIKLFVILLIFDLFLLVSLIVGQLDYWILDCMLISQNVLQSDCLLISQIIGQLVIQKLSNLTPSGQNTLIIVYNLKLTICYNNSENVYTSIVARIQRNFFDLLFIRMFFCLSMCVYLSCLFISIFA